MMMICTCDHCEKELIRSFGDVAASITLSKSTWCESCREHSEDKKTYNFCNPGCLVEFMNDVINGQRELKHD